MRKFIAGVAALAVLAATTAGPATPQNVKVYKAQGANSVRAQ